MDDEKPENPYLPDDEIFKMPAPGEWVSRDSDHEITARWNEKTREWRPCDPPEPPNVIETTYG